MCTHIRTGTKSIEHTDVHKREVSVSRGISIPSSMVYLGKTSLDNSSLLNRLKEENIIDSFLPSLPINPFLKWESVSDYWNPYIISWVPLLATHYKEREIWWPIEKGYILAAIRRGRRQYWENDIVTSIVTIEARKELNSSGLVHDRCPVIVE